MKYFSPKNQSTSQLFVFWVDNESEVAQSCPTLWDPVDSLLEAPQMWGFFFFFFSYVDLLLNSRKEKLISFVINILVILISFSD